MLPYIYSYRKVSNLQIPHHLRVNVLKVVVPNKSLWTPLPPLLKQKLPTTVLNTQRVTVKYNNYSCWSQKIHDKGRDVCTNRKKRCLHKLLCHRASLLHHSLLHYHVQTDWNQIHCAEQFSGPKTTREASNTIRRSVGDLHLPNFAYNEYGDNECDVTRT